jgi:predicted dehydrogenase
MSSRIRVGVIGAGAMGRNHARVLSTMESVEFTRVYDNDAGRAAEVAAEFGTTVASSMEELLNNVDAATVAAPTTFHLPLGLQLMDAGKHVFMEKPIADSVEAARKLIQKAADTGRILQVGHVERFNPVIAELEKRMDQPRFIEAHRLSPFPNRSTDIGVVLDLMIHDLEVILHLVKSDVVSVDAVGVSVLTSREDIANARLRFENGCVANITTSRISPDRLRKIRVFQSDAYLSLDYFAQSGEIYFKGPTGISREEIALEKQEPLRLELQAFTDCAASGARPKVGGQEAANALELALLITDKIAKQS